MSRKTAHHLGSLSVLLLMATACASTPTPSALPPGGATPPPVAPTAAAPPPKVTPDVAIEPGLTPKQRVRRAITLLAIGDVVHARPEVEEALKEEPSDDLGKLVLQQITADPKVMLGAQSFSYTIGSGETLSVLAERYLKNKFLFFALARYNGIVDPSQASTGQTILIPGVRRKMSPTHAKAEDEPSRPKSESSRPAGHDPVRASELRGKALQEMNQGLVAAAVGLLQQAQRLDPGNALIEADLARATRILGVIR